MTVAELISFLQTQPQEIQVAFRCFSEQRLLEADEIKICQLEPARQDGWVADLRGKVSRPYLVFPGN